MYFMTFPYRDVLDKPDSSLVNAYWEDENTLMASIRTDTEVYAIEVSKSLCLVSSNCCN